MHHLLLIHVQSTSLLLMDTNTILAHTGCSPSSPVSLRPYLDHLLFPLLVEARESGAVIPQRRAEREAIRLVKGELLFHFGHLRAHLILLLSATKPAKYHSCFSHTQYLTKLMMDYLTLTHNCATFKRTKLTLRRTCPEEIAVMFSSYEYNLMFSHNRCECTGTLQATNKVYKG